MKITKKEFFDKLDKINLLDYKINYQRNQNYFIYNNYKYVLETIINNGIIDNFYKFKL